MPRGNIANLKPWGPDNPPPKSPGRPPKRPVSRAYEHWLSEPISSERLAKFKSDGINFGEGATNADVMAFAIGQKAIRGDVAAAKELREAVQGKAPIEINVSGDRPAEFVVMYATAIPGSREEEEPGADLAELDGAKILDMVPEPSGAEPGAVELENGRTNGDE